MHPLVELARRAVEEYVRTGREVEKPAILDGVLSERAGVFVCLKARGQLRGCIGSILPVTDCVASEVIRNAVCAASQDPRFPPVGEAELKDMEYTVDVLTTPEYISNVSELDPRIYGVIVSRGGRKGLLLPDLEGVDTVDEQLGIALAKAGIDPSEGEIEVQRFRVIRYK